ncbi:hypothetical protein [Pseudonocardia xinjiangensis]|uniref:Circularly permuted ATP-grasp superfamily protein n=1 Tax=Pseudonocardia xinjiangensis TaxID=75289 RepID=A0ABX1RAC2_9PSEU|nr:hypothetical protein [Pseudonocardia xinjiangensis]NMH76731.1 hypothetical protein [Pseudonocardia xinjiangensis]
MTSPTGDLRTAAPLAAAEARGSAGSELLDLRVQDTWDALPAEFRGEFLTRRMTTPTGWGSYPRQESDGRRWEPLRPVIIGEGAYRGLESLAARLLHLAVDACRRRASTLGELRQVLRFPHELPLMDQDRPLVAAELTRYARPDILIENGRPRLLEFNNSTRLGGSMVTPRLADAYARLCPASGLHPPPSTVPTRSAALLRTLRAQMAPDNDRTGRVLMPVYRAVDNAGVVQRYGTAKPAILADARRAGIEVVEADLADLRLDGADRLLAGDAPVDLVLLHWGGNRIVEDGGGLAVLRAADRARTVALFPRTESALISSKAVLAWLHEDCDAGVLAPADRALVRTHVPWTACLGLDDDAAVPAALLRRITADRDRLVAKPAVGKSGNNVFFGSQSSEQDWSAVIEAAREAPVVLQHRIGSDRITMPFRDQDSGEQVTGRVPFVLGPYMIDGAAASIAVRHMGPGVPAGDVVISAIRGACQSTALLAPEPPGPGGWFAEAGGIDELDAG